MKRLIVVVLAVLMIAAPANAHTDTELDAWRAEWLATPAPSNQKLAELADMVSRHPCWPHACPVGRSEARGVTERTPSVYVSAGPGVEQWRGLVSAYFSPDWVEWALRIMQCESKGDPNATNSSSGAAGLFQHMPRYWTDRSSKAGWGESSIYDPTANVAVAAWLLSTGGTSHWTCKA